LSGTDRDDFVVPGPGEYEVGGVDVFGYNNAFRVVLDDISICLLAGETKLEGLGNVDILLVPANADAETVAKIEPMVVVPSGTSQEIEKFIKELGHEGIPAQPKLIISKDKLPETMTIVVLS